MILISGTQGEPMSALSRAAVDNHKHARVLPGDTVVLSSRVIPGNEKSIYRVIDHLCRRDANVIFDDGASGLIHVSGHASQEEQRLLINLLKPKFFIPVHGDYRHLKKHVDLAHGTGVVDLALIIEDGDVLELDRNNAQKTGRVTAGRVCIDSGSTVDVVEDLVIRDRRHLSEDGIVLAILTINKLSGKVERQPELVTRGFVGADTGAAGGGTAGCGPDPRKLQFGREGRLRRDQRKDPHRFEALYPEEHEPPAADHARDSGNLTARFWRHPCSSFFWLRQPWSPRSRHLHMRRRLPHALHGNAL